ncbi:MAG: helix-turn-helix transcriptional regulator [Clostridiales bacterium]|nr:helix-turn-helix transcriptional regulator [Clostridiales bacterium]
MVDFGNTLKILRLRENLTQSQLAKKLGLSKSVVSAYENGVRMPSYYVLIRISKVFNVSTDYLLGLEPKNRIDLSGLSQEETDAVLNLIRVMKRKFMRNNY